MRRPRPYRPALCRTGHVSGTALGTSVAERPLLFHCHKIDHISALCANLHFVISRRPRPTGQPAAGLGFANGPRNLCCRTAFVVSLPETAFEHLLGNFQAPSPQRPARCRTGHVSGTVLGTSVAERPLLSHGQSPSTRSLPPASPRLLSLCSFAPRSLPPPAPPPPSVSALASPLRDRSLLPLLFSLQHCSEIAPSSRSSPSLCERACVFAPSSAPSLSL